MKRSLNMKSPATTNVFHLSVFLFLLVVPVSGQDQPFRRGDTNASGEVDLTDGIATLNYLFLSVGHITCEDAADADDSGSLDITDAIFTFGFLFSGGRDPAPPGPRDCGTDPTKDGLGCEAHASCPKPPPPYPTLLPHPSLTAEDSITLFGRALPRQTIKIVGWKAPVTTTTGNDGSFSAVVQLYPNRVNNIYVTAISSDGTRSAPTPTRVTHDRTPPILHVDVPGSSGLVTTDQAVIAGRVGDRLCGYEGLEVTVNGVPAIVDPGIGPNGTFLCSGIPLPERSNRLVVQAFDRLGNRITKEITVIRVEMVGQRMVIESGDGQIARVKTQLQAPIVVRLSNEDGSPLVDKLVTFKVTRSDGRLSRERGKEPGEMLHQTRSDASGLAWTWWTLGSDVGCGNNRVQVESAAVSGNVFFCASSTPEPAKQINIGSGNHQFAEVGSPAPEPLRIWVSDSRNGIRDVPVTFRVKKGGGLVNGRTAITVGTTVTGHAEVLFTAGPEPGENLIEANFPTSQSLPAYFQVTGMRREPQSETTFTGVVLSNADEPLEGAACLLEIPFHEPLQTQTDRRGRFSFTLPTSGPVSLQVAGETVEHVGGDPGRDVQPGSFPSLTYDTVMVANTENSLGKPVFLPEMNPKNARLYDGTQDVELTVEGVEGLKMIVKAGSMRRADGTKPTPEDPAAISLNQVNYDKIPMPMPDGVAPPFSWTLQPSRSTFDPPVIVRCPNMTGVQAGATAEVLTFDHATGQFEIVASAQVSTDGSLLTTDPASGISTAGWGSASPTAAPTGAVDNCKPNYSLGVFEDCTSDETVILLTYTISNMSSCPQEFLWTLQTEPVPAQPPILLKSITPSYPSPNSLIVPAAQRGKVSEYSIEFTVSIDMSTPHGELKFVFTAKPIANGAPIADATSAEVILMYPPPPELGGGELTRCSVRGDRIPEIVSLPAVIAAGSGAYVPLYFRIGGCAAQVHVHSATIDFYFAEDNIDKDPPDPPQASMSFDFDGADKNLLVPGDCVSKNGDLDSQNGQRNDYTILIPPSNWQNVWASGEKEIASKPFIRLPHLRYTYHGKTTNFFDVNQARRREIQLYIDERTIVVPIGDTRLFDFSNRLLHNLNKISQNATPFLRHVRNGQTFIVFGPDQSEFLDPPHPECITEHYEDESANCSSSKISCREGFGLDSSRHDMVVFSSKRRILDSDTQDPEYTIEADIKYNDALLVDSDQAYWSEMIGQTRGFIAMLTYGNKDLTFGGTHFTVVDVTKGKAERLEIDAFRRSTLEFSVPVKTERVYDPLCLVSSAFAVGTGVFLVWETAVTVTTATLLQTAGNIKSVLKDLSTVKSCLFPETVKKTNQLAMAEVSARIVARDMYGRPIINSTDTNCELRGMLGIQLRSFDDELHTLGPDILVIDSATLGRISGRLFGEVALADAHDGYIVFHRSSVRAHGHFRDDVSASAKVTFSLTPEFYKNFASVASRNSYTKPPDINGGSAPEKLSEPCK